MVSAFNGPQMTAINSEQYTKELPKGTGRETQTD